jgi:hypothetical protein
MGSGDPPGLQNRRTASFGVVGGFDSHSLPPFLFNPLEGLGLASHIETLGENCLAAIKMLPLERVTWLDSCWFGGFTLAEVIRQAHWTENASTQAKVQTAILDPVLPCSAAPSGIGPISAWREASRRLLACFDRDVLLEQQIEQRVLFVQTLLGCPRLFADILQSNMLPPNPAEFLARFLEIDLA